MMDFSFIQDARWAGFDSTTRQRYLDAAFARDVETDDRWGGIAQERQAALRDTYMSQAAEESESWWPSESEVPEISEDEPDNTLAAGAHGMQKLAGATRIFWNVLTKDEEEATKLSKEFQGYKTTDAQSGFQQSLQENQKDNTAEGVVGKILEAVSDIGSAAVDNPRGFAHLTAEQIPNMIPTMAGMYLGTKGGAVTGAAIGTVLGPGGTAVGGVVGGFVGGMLGMIAGNTVTEGGYIAQGDINAGEYDREEMLSKGLKKGAIIAVVDKISFGITGGVYKAISKPMRAAGEKAMVGVLTKAGMHELDDVALQVALKSNPTVKVEVTQAVKQAMLDAAPSKAKQAMAASVAQINEMFSEGIGDYAGSAANGDANIADSVLEAVSAFGSSVGEVALGKSMALTKQTAKVLTGKRQTTLSDIDAAPTHEDAANAAAAMVGEELDLNDELDAIINPEVEPTQEGPLKSPEPIKEVAPEGDVMVRVFYTEGLTNKAVEANKPAGEVLDEMDTQEGILETMRRCME